MRFIFVFHTALVILAIISPENSAVWCSNSNNRSRTLRQVHVIFRHGDRSPIQKFPLDQSTFNRCWPQGLSVLSKRGQQETHELGQYIRERYDGFLRRSYNPEDVHVVSSSMDRTILSALCVLAGLYPVTEESRWNDHINWQPAPVYSISETVDNFINVTNCPRYSELHKEFLTNTEYAKRINGVNENLYRYISTHTGENITNFEQVSYLFDTLFTQKLYNCPLPQWAYSVYEDMKAIYPISKNPEVYFPTLEAKRLRFGPLFTRIFRNIDAIAHPSGSNTPVKMHMISGHDFNIAGTLGVLKVYDSIFPPYASAIFIELHEQNWGDKSAFDIQVFYRNSTNVPPYELRIPGCEYPCQLDQLKSLVKDIFLNDDEWKKACRPKGGP